MPLPSHSNSFRRLPQRLLDDGRQYPCALVPTGTSTGDTANKICGGLAISLGIATAPPALPPMCPAAAQASCRPRAVFETG